MKTTALAVASVILTCVVICTVAPSPASAKKAKGEGVRVKVADGIRAADILSLKLKPDAEKARVKVSVNRPDEPVYFTTESVVVVYRADVEGYASIIDFTPDGYATVIVANEFMRRDKAYYFPGIATGPGGREYLLMVFGDRTAEKKTLEALATNPLADGALDPFIGVAATYFDVKPLVTIPGGEATPQPSNAEPTDESAYYARFSKGRLETKGLTLSTGAESFTDYDQFGPFTFFQLWTDTKFIVKFTPPEGFKAGDNATLVVYAAGGFPHVDVPDFVTTFVVKLNSKVVESGVKPPVTTFAEGSGRVQIDLADVGARENTLIIAVEGASTAPLRIRGFELRFGD